jgi:hypothetical protein
VELMLNDRYMHPNGQIPAYEWNFGDVNPPVHAMAAIKVFRAERTQRGEGDHGFLQRVFHKLLLNFSWWINRKDADGHNLFEGGFLGLDNISRLRPLQAAAAGYSPATGRRHRLDGALLAEDDAIALELCVEDPDYEDIAIHCYKQFLSIAEAIAGSEETGTPSLWDMEIGFFTDLLVSTRRHPPHRGLLLGRADPAVRGRDRQQAHAASMRRDSRPCSRAQGRPVPRQLYLRLPGLGERARRAAAGAGGPQHAAAHPGAAAGRGAVPVAATACAASARSTNAQRPRLYPRHRPRADRVHARGIQQRPVRRQLQLARPGLAARPTIR